MDIDQAKGAYDAMKSARADVVKVAVEEILALLDGLDNEVCAEILGKVKQERNIATLPLSMPKVSLFDDIKAREQRTQATLQQTGHFLVEQAREERAAREAKAAQQRPNCDPMADLDKDAILKSALDLWK